MRALTTAALVLALAAMVLGQGGAGINGKITDQRGDVIRGAEVRLRSLEGIALFSRTDDSGFYSFTGLKPGDYILEVKASGFATTTSARLRLSRGKIENQDFALSVAGVNESVVVVGTGTPERVDQAAKSLTLIDEREIETRHIISLSDALSGTPGLRVQQQGSPGALTTLRFRGERNSDTAILLDGLRVRDASDINGSAGPFFSDFLPVDLDRIEVLRGSGSSNYGTNAIGGVVNLVPNTGSGSPQFEAGFEGGSLALFRENLQGAGGIGRRAGYSFGVTRLDVRRGIDRQDQYGDTAAAARVQFNATPSLTLSATFYGTISNARVNDSPFALPAAFATGERFPRAIPGVTFQPDFNNPDEGRRNRLLVGSFRLAETVNDTFSYTVAYQRVSTRRRNYNGPQIDPRFASFYPFGDFEFNDTNAGVTDTLDARMSLRLGREDLATAGFEYERESLFQQAIPSFSVFNNTTDRQQTFAVFGQDQVFLLDGRLQFSVAARAQSYRLRPADRPETLGAAGVRGSLTGDAAVAYVLRSTGTKFRAHAGNGFRAPSLFERFGVGTFANMGTTRFGDPTLRAEQSISVEGGVDQTLAADRVRFGATWFYTRLQRVIAFTAFAIDPLGAGRFSGYVNRPGGISRGFEAYVESTPYRGAHLRAAYTFTNSDQVIPGSGTLPEYVVPRHLFGLVYTQRYRNVAINVDVNRTGQYIAPVFENGFPFRTAILTFPGFTKVDLFASYERGLREQMRIVIFAGADNILNELYFENGFRAPRIMARAGATLRF